ncbi:SRPBCC domain-containing protein [Roseibium sp. SCPC15]|uniref:SRPBCC family protein n=1 Tax=Roseibium sp. SCP15 TaxID=3141376 RepID=UPI00333B2DA8
MCAVQIDLERECSVSAQNLWDVLLQPPLWWGRGVKLDPAPGGIFYEPWQDANGAHHTHGKVTAIEPPRLLVMSWWDDDWSFKTEVTFQVKSVRDHSRISLTHKGWEAAPKELQRELIDAHSQGWSYHLDNLVTCAGQGR